MKKMLNNYLNVFLLRLLCCVRSMLEVLFLITRGSLSFFGSNSFFFASISWGFKQDSIFSNHPCSSAMWWRSENIKKEICQQTFCYQKFIYHTPRNVLSLHLKQTFPPIIWIFTEGEGDGIKFRLPFKIFCTLTKCHT